MLKERRRIDITTKEITDEGQIMLVIVQLDMGNLAYGALGHGHAENGKYVT